MFPESRLRDVLVTRRDIAELDSISMLSQVSRLSFSKSNVSPPLMTAHDFQRLADTGRTS